MLRVVFSRTFEQYAVRGADPNDPRLGADRDPLFKKILSAAGGGWRPVYPVLTDLFTENPRRARGLRYGTAGGRELRFAGVLRVKARIVFDEEFQTYRFVCRAAAGRDRVLIVEPGRTFAGPSEEQSDFYFLRWPAGLLERSDFLRGAFRLEDMVLRREELIELGIQGARDLPRPLERGPAWCVSLEPGPDRKQLSIRGKLEIMYGRRASDLKAYLPAKKGSKKTGPFRSPSVDLVFFPPGPPRAAHARAKARLTATGGGRIVKRSPELERRLYKQGLPVACQPRTGRFELGPRRLEAFIRDEYPALIKARIPVRLHPDLVRLFSGASAAAATSAHSASFLTLYDNGGDPEPGRNGGWFAGRVAINGLAREEWAAVVRAVRAGRTMHRLGDGAWIALSSLGVDSLIRLLEELGVKVKADGSFAEIGRGQLAALDEAGLLERASIDEQEAQTDEPSDEANGERGRRLIEALREGLQELRLQARSETNAGSRRKRRRHISPGPGFRAKLRPYQRDGLDFFYRLFEFGVGGILADDMGLGKTVQSLAFLSRVHAGEFPGKNDLDLAPGTSSGPSLIVGPLAALSVWRREAERFCPGLEVTLWHGPERKRLSKPAGGLVLTTYAVLARDIDRLGAVPFRAVIVDEAQNVKNDRARAARALRKLNARAVFCLSGTPLENHPADFWSLMDVCFPGLLGTRAAFLKSLGEDPGFAALKRRVAPFFLRRTKENVLKELPPRTVSNLAVPLTKVGRALYEKARRVAFREWNAGDGTGGAVFRMLPHLTRLRRLACHPRLDDSRRADPLLSGKLNYLDERMDELRETAAGVLIFSQFTDMLELAARLLERRKEPYFLLRGDTAARAREKQVKSFQAGERRFFLISLRAGGTALTLTRADTVFHLDPWWNPAAEDQATDRAYRMGQTRPVFVYKLFGENTVEEKVLALQAKKRALFRELFAEGATETIGPRLRPEDLLKLLE